MMGRRWLLAALAALALPGCVEERILYDSTGPRCACPDPNAACVDGLCVEIGACTATGCGTAYDCNVDPQFPDAFTPACVCGYEPERWAQCAPACETDGDCGAEFRCRQPDGLCVHDHRCLTSDVCDADAVCAYDYDFDASIYEFTPYSPTRCRPTGTRQLGEECNEDAECRSARCGPDGVCDGTIWCSMNADCASDERCVTNSCRRAQGVCEYCDLPGHFCDEYSGACQQRCTTSADCEEVDCTLDTLAGLLCADVPRQCADDEFRPGSDEGDLPGAPRCLLHQTCWVTQDCPDGYECLPVTDGATGYCGRQL